MKQATGKTNAVRAPRRVSIQQSLDGRSFSVTDAKRDIPDAETVVVELRTWQTLLVPTEAFAPEKAPELLAAAGMACTSAQQAVWTPARENEEAIAVMAMNRECLRRLKESTDAKIEFTTPLLYTPKEAEGCCVWLRQAGHVLYIKVYDGTLRLAEAIPRISPDDPLYFIERLSKAFPLWEFDLLVAGDNSRALRKLISGYFKNATCE